MPKLYVAHQVHGEGVPRIASGAQHRDMLTFHHVGCVVDDLAEAIEAYRPVARTIGEVFHIATENVRLCFVGTGSDSFIELIEPSGGESVVNQLLKKRITFYHIGLIAPDFDAAIEHLVGEGYVHLRTFRSEAFAMRRCAFLASPIAHLIEIIEGQ
jgi:hypothetical protein